MDDNIPRGCLFTEFAVSCKLAGHLPERYTRPHHFLPPRHRGDVSVTWDNFLAHHADNMLAAIERKFRCSRTCTTVSVRGGEQGREEERGEMRVWWMRRVVG